MGIHTLFGLYFAVFSVSTLAADPPVPRGNVSAIVNPTTGYYSSTNSTVRLPSGVSISPSSASVPVVSKYSGGLQQTIPTGITIDAIKKSAPLPAVVRATTQSVKTAATRCLTSGRCNVALMLAGQGISSLIDSLDWVIGEGGQIQKKEYTGEGGNLQGLMRSNGDGIGILRSSSCPSFIPSGATISCTVTFDRGSSLQTDSFIIEGASFARSITVYRSNGAYRIYNYNRVNTGSISSVDVPASEVAPAVDSNYVPEPSDWPALTSELELDDLEIISSPTLSSNPKTTTIYDADGNPVEVQETNIWYDFDIRDNPSPSPSLDLKTRQETKTYKNGALTGTTTTTDTDSAGTATGGGGSNVEIDIPTDCEFMPTVCAFLDWVKNDDTPEDPDLSALIDNRDFTESYTISGGSKQCPVDYEFTVDFIGRTYGLSFEPACDFASKMYYFVMAAAYIFAAYITIGASRNG